jgi:hypothetical protein
MEAAECHKGLASATEATGGVQANDAGWSCFEGKNVAYPCFRKEWWAYRRSYHARVRLELVEKCLTSGVKFIVGYVEDKEEVWDTMDKCFDQSEKYMA